MDPGFGGLDLYHTPDALNVGDFIQGDNLYNVGSILMIRPGKQAQLSVAEGSAVYALGSMLDSSGNTWILYVAGGKLKKIAATGSNTATEIKLSPGATSLDLANGGATAQGVVYGGYFYFIDGDAGGSGVLYKTDLTNAYEVTALNEPTVAPVATAIANQSISGFWPSSASYDAPPTYASTLQACVATAAHSGGIIGAITVVHPGIYITGATVTATIVDPAGSGAVLAITMSGGGITGIAVTNGGSGYTPGTFAISVTGGGGTGATGTATASAGGVVTSVAVGAAGSGYTSLPVIGFSAGGGTGATATPTLSNSTVSSVSTTSGGTGYTNPVVVFTVPSGTLTNFFPNSCFPFSGQNWNGYEPDVGDIVTSVWTGAGNSFGGAGSYARASMSTLANPAPIGAGGTANYDFDTKGNAISWNAFYGPGANISLTNPIGNIPHGDNSGEWASQFVVGFYYFQSNPNAAITIKVTATTAAGTTSTKKQSFHPTAITGANVSVYSAGSLLFDFSELQTATDHIYKWAFEADSDSLTGGYLDDYQGILVAYFTGGPIWGNLSETLGNFSTGLYKTQQQELQRAAGGWIADSQADDALPSLVVDSLTKDARLTISFGSGASCTVTTAGGAVTNLTSFTGGSGYLPGTVINFTGGGGSGASAVATVVNGAITGFTDLVGGSGYTGTPTAIFGYSFATTEYVDVPLTGFLVNGTLAFTYPNFSLVLRLLPAGTNQSYQSVLMTIDSSGAFASTDLTSLIPADLACVAGAQIEFIDNPAPSSQAFSFNIGGFTLSGNLAVGFANYTYLYTEVDSNGDATLVLIIQSDPSPYSNAITPTGAAAAAQVLLPDASLLNPGVSDRFFLYREGGTEPNDGEPTLVFSATWSESFGMGDQPASDSPTELGLQLNPNPYVSWGDPSGPTAPTGFKYAVDNTPDQNIQNNPTLIVGRQPAPTGCTSIARFQNRLFLGKGGNIISSWLLNENSDAGTYFNPTVDPTDPNAPILGSGFQPVGNDDNDPVVGLQTLGNVLTIWKGLSTYFLDGADPTNFGLNEYQALAGQGLVAPKGIATADNVIYMAQQDGIYTFDGSQLQKISDPVGSLLTPVLNEDGGQVSASAYANLALGFHGGRLYAFAPVAGGSQNSQAFLWDTRFPSWVGRWTSMNITSMVSIGNSADDPDMWCGGYDGQLYRFAGNGDTAAPSAITGATNATPIVITQASHGFSTGNIVQIAGVEGNTAANGQWAITVLTSNTYSLNGSVGNGSYTSSTGTAALVSAVSITLTTRAYGRPPQGLSIWLQGRYNLPLGIEDKAWLPWFLKARVVRLQVVANSYNANGPVAISPSIGTVYLDSQVANTYSLGINGYQRQMVKPKNDRGGLGISVTFSGSTVDNLEILGLGLIASRGARNN